MAAVLLRNPLIASFILSALPTVALAGPCEDSFVKKGSPIGGLRFIATTTVTDLTPASAIRQLQGMAVTRNYDVLAVEAEDGSMLIEQAQTGAARSFPIIVTASHAGGMGTVRLEAKLPTAMFAGTEGAKNELCAMLNQLKGGKAGLALAARAKGAVSTQAPLAIDAQMLSSQISKDTERNAAAIPLRYKNKAFTVSGTVDYVMRDGDYYRVAYKVLNPWELAIRLPGAAQFKTDISCLLAKGQSVFALTLKPGRSIKLTGTYRDFDEFKHVIWLENCRPA